jgi:hypothetical protein
MRTSELQEKPSALKREHLAHKNMKVPTFLYFSGLFFFFMDPDAADQNQCDPDLQHFFQQ